MYTKVKTFTYLIAFVIIMFPIILEQLGNPMSAMMETIVLTIGLVVLFFGKLTYVSRMKKAGQRPGTHDTLILAIILFMIAYVLYNYFT